MLSKTLAISHHMWEIKGTTTYRTLNKEEDRDIKWGNYTLPLKDNIPVFLNQDMCIQITIILIESINVFNNNKISEEF